MSDHVVTCDDCGEERPACEDESEPSGWWTEGHRGRCCDCFDLSLGCPPEAVETRREEGGG